jgi:protoporphyrin/coproporphyrin ferrochelatase
MPVRLPSGRAAAIMLAGGDMAWYRSVPAPGAAGPARSGVLVMNLGTPAAPAYRPIRRFLRDFLSDRRVVEASPAYWYPILWGPILSLRPLRTRRWYQSVWLPDGPPLLVYSQRLVDRLASALSAQRVPVVLAMTYGEPSVAQAMRSLQDAGITRLIVLPLYPQYSGTTTGAAFDAIARELGRWRVVPELRFVRDYHDDGLFIDALAGSVRRAWEAAGGRTHLVCSYHGIPSQYVAQGDPYAVQAERTTELLAHALGLKIGEYSRTYQSRFGPTRWLEPSTFGQLTELARGGTGAVTVVTPSFAVDCLETLEEIAVRGAAAFRAAGGKTFHLVPALNDQPEHVRALLGIIRRGAAGWNDLAKAPPPG